MLHQRVEEAALNAWPALQHLLYDGWLLRFANGYTQRANSVTPLFNSRLDLAEKITFCAHTYARKNLPCIFRLPSFAAPELDDLLAQRGYKHVAQTSVLHRDLHTLPRSTATQIHHDLLDGWLATWCQLSGTTLDQHHTHAMLLARIAAQPLFATLQIDGDAVACGLGVLEDTLFGLFDIVTAPHQRNHGYGTQLVSSMLAWAASEGAQQAYLQVVSTNAAALHVYAKLEFTQLYHYWYRVAPT